MVRIKKQKRRIVDESSRIMLQDSDFVTGVKKGELAVRYSTEWVSGQKGLWLMHRDRVENWAEVRKWCKMWKKDAPSRFGVRCEAFLGKKYVRAFLNMKEVLTFNRLPWIHVHGEEQDREYWVFVCADKKTDKTYCYIHRGLVRRFDLHTIKGDGHVCWTADEKLFVAGANILAGGPPRVLWDKNRKDD